MRRLPTLGNGTVLRLKALSACLEFPARSDAGQASRNRCRLNSRSASVQACSGAQPAACASAWKSSIAYLCEFSVWMRSPLAKLNERPSTRTVWRGETHKMHLDAAACLVIDGVMGEAIEVDVAVELAIDALEQIEVEGGRDPAPVVIGGEQDRRRPSSDRRRRGTQRRARAAAPRWRGNARASAWVRLPMVEPEKKPSLRGRRASHGQRAGLGEVGDERPDGEAVMPLGEPLCGLGQALAGNVDRHVEADAGERARAAGSSCGSSPSRTRPARRASPMRSAISAP